MKTEIIERTLAEADYLLSHEGTVRSLGKIFHVSKSTVHYDLSFRLKKIDKSTYNLVKKILKTNLEERHIRGGEATKKHYEKMRKKLKK